MTARTLQLAPDFSLPLDAATRRMAVLAMSGAGKSNTAVVLAEAMYDAGIPWVAIDPKGDWWGIRSNKSGKGPGLPIPIFGGAHGDVPLEAGAGKILAQAIHAQRLTCVVDVSEFDELQQMWGFLRDFGHELLRLHKAKPQICHLFLEECDEYIPQKPSEKGNQIKCLSVWQRVVKKGRTPGLGTTQITQRSASLNKDTLYQAELLIALRVTGKGDRDAIRGWVEYHHAGEEIIDSLPTLKDGEAWTVSPGWLRDMRRVRFLRRRTFDSGATPELLESAAPAATLADIDLGALRDRMAATIEKAKVEDPQLLQQRVKQLERELAAAKKTPAPAPIVPQVETKIEHVDVPAIPQAQIDELVATAGDLHHILEQSKDLASQFIGARGGLSETMEKLERAIAQAGVLVTRAAAAKVQTTAKPPVRAEPPRSRGALTRTGGWDPLDPRKPDPPLPTDSSLDGPAQRILDALAELEAIGAASPPRELVCFLAGYSHIRSKGFSNACGSLRSAGRITYTGDGRVQLTPDGRALAHVAVAPASPAELQSRILLQLGAPAGKILEPLIDAYPESISKEQLLDHSGYGHTRSKGFSNICGRLRTLGFIEYPTPGQVRAAPVLFLEGGA
jgi:hypothetical protein